MPELTLRTWKVEAETEWAIASAKGERPASYLTLLREAIIEIKRTRLCTRWESGFRR